MAGFIAPIIGGLAGLFGGGTQKKTQTSGTINTTNTNNSTTTPNLSPFQTSLANLFTQGLASQYNNATNLTGYTQGGLENINNSANASNQILQNTLASRGLSYSPAAASAITQGQQSRLAQGNQFLSQIPLLQQQLKSQALGQAVAGFAALPTGQSTSGTSTSNQTQQGTNLVSGNPTAGAISGAGAGLFAPTGPGGQNSLSSILSMFGNPGGAPTATGPSTNYGQPGYQP